MDNTSKSALVLGSTGLIGNQLLQVLLSDAYYDKVYAVSRHELEISNDKLITIIADYDNVGERLADLTFDDIYCCLGTTIKKAGNKEAFKQIDLDYPLKVAEQALRQGAKQYLLISAMGADKKSTFFYNRVKGEVEEALANMKYNSIHIFRPSLLLGDREEKRPGEAAATVMSKLFSFAFVGPLMKYKPIESVKVARAMLASAKEKTHGVHIHESEDLQKY
ncbi:NAD-dependent epimerase/dehydratase family protein [Fulvivirga maritima]|uniref:NAD-dependent epimerase/dehydratase family protein n=1 Tax=Fulvivirga maritima TaxID=2904247 RepID=UPI001F34CCF2|nr:NAD-dependent epimerase/dehydratase family protein [Fulvivirga maritima]UII29270.1 NAD-dependent epimerase/dehydratase family protein [Fulvivirga maritima]